MKNSGEFSRETQGRSTGQRRLFLSFLATSTSLMALSLGGAALADPASSMTAAQWAADSEFTGNWGLGAINAGSAYALGYSGKGVEIGIIDTGINVSHSEFFNKIDFTAANKFAKDNAWKINDGDGHGSHVAGISSAARNNSGMMGVAYDSTILPLYTVASAADEKIPNLSMPSSTSAIQFIRDLNRKTPGAVSVINGSYGPGFVNAAGTRADPENDSVKAKKWVLGASDITEGKMLREAIQEGVVPVYAAGNYRAEMVAAGLPNLADNPTGAGFLPYITPKHSAEGTVYSIGSEDATTDFGDLKGKIVVVVNVEQQLNEKEEPTGRYVISSDSIRCGVTAEWCIAAPGTNIKAPIVGNQAYGNKSGTSMASPFVAGAFGVVKQAFPDFSVESLVTTVLTTANTSTSLLVPTSGTAFEPLVYGQGLLDLGKAVRGPGRFDKTFEARVETKSVTFSNDITGSGGLNKTGRQSLSLAGQNSYTGGTTVSEGRLAVDGSVASDVLVKSGATLGGSGTIKGKTTVDGKLSPGNSIGTLTIQGDLELKSDGHLVIQMANGKADAVQVTGSTVLDGEVDFEEEPGGKVVSSTFKIMDDAEGITGTFQVVADQSPFLRESLVYGPTGVSAVVTHDFALPATSGNQRAIAAHLNASYRLGDQGDLDNVFAALDSLETDAAGREALDQLSGASLGDATSGALMTRGLAARTLEDRLAQRRNGDRAVAPVNTARLGRAGFGDGSSLSSLAGQMAEAAGGSGLSAGGTGSGLSAWARGLGGFGSVGANSEAAGFSLRSAGVMAGVDTALGDNWVVGASLGYLNARQATERGSNRSESNNHQFSLYGGWQSGRLFADGQLGYTYARYDTRRSLDFGGLSREASGQADGHDLTLATKLGLRTEVAGFALEPSLGLDWYRVSRGGFTESGAGSAGLQVGDQVVNAIKPSLGFRASTTVQVGDDLRLTPDLRARWYHDLGDDTAPVTASLIGAPGAAFTTTGTVPGRDSAVLGMGLSAELGGSLRLSLGYEADLAARQTGHAFTGGIKYTW
jgi:subtilase-type serine protease